MPYKKGKKGGKRKYKKNYKKKNYKAKFNKNWQITQPQMLVADRQFVKLKYSEVDVNRTQVTIPVGQNLKVITYRSNDLRDPNTTATLPQRIPGLKAWSTFYARYKVHSVKFKFMICSDDGVTVASLAKPCLAAIHCQSDPAPGTFATWGEFRQLDGNRYSTWKPIAITENGGQTLPTVLKKFYRLKYASGNPKQFSTDIAYEAATNPLATPARLFNTYLALMTMDGAITLAAQTFSVYATATYYVEFKDRIDQAE